jgi:iron-sulfur cluster repair protein YtfE (RIC family)
VASAADPIVRFEHEHVHVAELVERARDALAEARQLALAPPPAHAARHKASVWGELADALRALYEDLIDHFGREEEALFPHVREVMPELSAAVSELEAAHDAVCGAVGRLLHLVERMAEEEVVDALARDSGGGERLRFGESAAADAVRAAESLFQRFDEAYRGHAVREHAFLERVARDLPTVERSVVERLLRELG